MTGNITFLTILFVIVLIVPGVIFKRFYFQGPFINQFGIGNFADRIITTLWLGLLVQIITFLIIGGTFKSQAVEYKAGIQVIYDSLRCYIIPDIPSEIFKYTLVYFFASIILSAALGHFCHKVVREFNMDKKDSVWRFHNDWHYHFTGEDLPVPAYDPDTGTKRSFESTFVELEVEGGKDRISRVTGTILNYRVDHQGNLLYILLAGAKSKLISPKNEEEEEEFLPGKCHVVAYSQVRRMSLNYVYAFRGKVKRRYNKKLVKIFKVAWFITLPGFVIVPWWTDFSIGSKVIVVSLLFIIWILLNVIIENMLLGRRKLKRQELIVLVLFAVFFVFVGLYVLKILPQVLY